jgi:hypothetical protein
LRCKPALALGLRQRVAGQREVVHADVFVAARHEGGNGIGVQVQAHVGGRDVGAVDAALRLEALRQVRIGVQRDAVRAQLQHLLQGGVEAGLGLQGQAADEVQIDRGEAQFAGILHQLLDLLEGLHAVHRLLHARIEILHAVADAVEAQLLQMRQARAGHGARVDLDRCLDARQPVEGLAQTGGQPAQLLVRQEGGCAAAQVHLRHRRPPPEVTGPELDLGVEQLQVFGPALMVLGDDLVAGAVVAQRLAERHMDIDRQRSGLARTLVTLHQRRLVLCGSMRLDEAIRRGIAGVARPRRPEAVQQGGR